MAVDDHSLVTARARTLLHCTLNNNKRSYRAKPREPNTVEVAQLILFGLVLRYQSRSGWCGGGDGGSGSDTDTFMPGERIQKLVHVLD